MGTFLQTKKYENIDNDYFWVQNIDIKGISVDVHGYRSSNGVECSMDKTNWTSVSGQSNFYLNKPGDRLYLRAKSIVPQSSENGNFWIVSHGYYEMGGSLPALIDYEHKENVTTIPQNYLVYLAGGITSGDVGYYSKYLIKADRIDFGNITTVEKNGMYNMFRDCNNLIIPPDLSSITTVGEKGMFNMFKSCIKLKSVPDLSSITTVGDYGLRDMFYDCWAIETGADLSSLTTIGNYGCMSMYQNCSYLKEATYPNVSTYDNNKTNQWLYNAGNGVTGTKTVYCPTGVVIPTDSYDAIPTGWTRVDY